MLSTGKENYIALVQALLECEAGAETDLLADHPELVNEELVTTLLAVVQTMDRQNDPELGSTIEWLNDFAAQLAADLGLEMAAAEDSDSSAELEFLLNAFQAIPDSDTNPQVVYPILRDNLDLLTEELIPLITSVLNKFGESGDEAIQFIAAVIVDFANLIAQFPLGSRLANLEIAIHCYQLALDVYTREAFPEQWATTQINLAGAYLYRIRGERATNLETSIYHYQSALEVYTRDTFPEQWARTRMNLATAYRERIRGERATNLEESIYHYQSALKVYTHDAFPEMWATTQMNLAVAYSNRIRGDKADNLEASIQCYQLVLEVYTREAYPEQWAGTQMNLGIAYRNRIRGDKATNLEESIHCYQSALEVYTHEAYPEQWARTRMNLATAYSERIWGNKAGNLEESIQCYQLALEVRTREAYPEQWARTQMNLAIAYSNRIWGERTTNLEESIQCYQLALEVYTREAYPYEWARTQNNLANAYSNRIWGDRAANLEESISRYKLALEVYTHDSFPIDWAMTLNNLGTVYGEIDRVSEAINCYQSALEIRTPSLLPLDCLTTSRNLGNLAFKQGDWALSIDAYDLAIQAVETSRSWAMSDASRQDILRDSISVYENAIQASINYHRLDLAIQYSERARSRQLVDFMSTKDLYPDGEIPAQVADYIAQYHELEAQIHHLQNDYSNSQFTLTRNPNVLNTISAEIQTLEAQKQQVWQQIRAYDPIFATQQQVTPLDIATIQNLITNPHTAILSFYTTDDDTHIFILTQNNEPQIHTCLGQGWENFQLWLRETWLTPYIQERVEWRGMMTNTLTEISHRLRLDDLVTNLPQIEELIIIPHLFLHQIPFAALPLTGTDAGLLGDKFTVRYAPSCQILKYCSERDPVEFTQYGMVENTDGTLPGTIYECNQIAELLAISPEFRLRGKEQATVDNFLTLIKTSITDLHVASHGFARFDNPLESSLRFTDGDFKLDRLLLSRFPHLQEIFLSCCETHLGTTTITDDLLTLGTGFLCAGARTVISTLWAVDDLATALVSIFYYNNCHNGFGRAKSLKMAQVTLRNLNGEVFQRNYAEGLENHLSAYARQVQRERKAIDATANRQEYERLTGIYNKTMEVIKNLRFYSEKDNNERPFADPYYWAAFTCQGLG